MNELRSQVTEFHRAFDHPIATSPTVPTDERVRFRARLIIEECIEMIEALFDSNRGLGSLDRDGESVSLNMAFMLKGARVALDNIIEYAAVNVHLPDFIDALADIDYVVEGARLEFGVDGDPIAREVHRSNMAKFGAKKRADGKTLKPPDWTPPDIIGELARQRRPSVQGDTHVDEK